jgi:hypothetical protein
LYDVESGTFTKGVWAKAAKYVTEVENVIMSANKPITDHSPSPVLWY